LGPFSYTGSNYYSANYGRISAKIRTFLYFCKKIAKFRPKKLKICQNTNVLIFLQKKAEYAWNSRISSKKAKNLSVMGCGKFLGGIQLHEFARIQPTGLFGGKGTINYDKSKTNPDFTLAPLQINVSARFHYTLRKFVFENGHRDFVLS
jgi:hypothetical protein